MMKDKVIQEVWRVKDATAAKYNHDVTAMATGLREREKLSSARVVNLHARRRADTHTTK